LVAKIISLKILIEMTFKTILEKFVSDIMNPLLIVMIVVSPVLHHLKQFELTEYNPYF